MGTKTRAAKVGGRPASESWISASQAAAILGCTRDAVARMVRDRRITVRVLPGTYSRLLRSDVERLAREAIRPAESAAD